MKISYSKLSVFLSNNELSETFQKNLHNAYESLQNIEIINKKLIISNNLEIIVSDMLASEYSNKVELNQNFSKLNSWLMYFIGLTEDNDLRSRMIDIFLSNSNRFYLYIADSNKENTFRDFLKEILIYFNGIENLSHIELRYLIQICVFYSIFHRDFNIDLNTLKKYQNEDLNVYELFDQLFVRNDKPVLLTDNFHNLKSFEELRFLADILLGKDALKSKIIKGEFSKQEYRILISQNHPLINLDAYAFKSAITLSQYLYHLNLNQNLIYRLFQFDPTLSETFILELNNYISNSKSEPVLKDLQNFIYFLRNRPSRNLFGENTNYLFKKEMSVLFKNNITSFVDYCENKECKSNQHLIYIEWIEPSHLIGV
jgi:hypothetical protein